MASLPEWARRARGGWRYTGTARPPFAVEPGPGQESVWDYPRPPRLAPDAREIVVRVGAIEIARTRHGLRVLETASPPTFYLPPDAVRRDCLEAASGSSACEWKGEAQYWTIVAPGLRLERAAWSYPDPLPGFEALTDFVSFYPSRVECWGRCASAPAAGTLLWRLGDAGGRRPVQGRARIGRLVTVTVHGRS